MDFKVIGLCGGSGSGKGVVGSLFSAHGYIAIDTDKVYREITDNKSHCLDALVCEFGGTILTKNASLDRRKLAGIVFSDKEKLKKLNAITHKYILDEVRNIINTAKCEGYSGALVDAPLLYESGFYKECDVVIAVIADKQVRISRIIERDSISREEAERRINSQLSDEILCTRVDYVIENNGALEEIKECVSNIVFKLQKE